jgi:membrane-associated protease RseP (regulator of RpoE activity)
MLTLIVLASALSALRDADARIAVVAWRLQKSNVAMCGDGTPLAGFSIETLDQYNPSERGKASAEFGLRDLPQVSAVVPESAAGKAGLKPGDTILAVNGQPMPRAVGGRPDYGRTAAAEGVLAAALAQPPVTLTLTSRIVSFSPDRGCASSVQLVPGGRLDAVADGQYVQISGAMYGFVANDDELAFVLAHELAHNVVPEAKHAATAAGQRAAELAADRAAIHMMEQAGYDVGVVVPLMERLRRKNRLSWLDGSHPAWSYRLAAAARAAAEANRIPK